MSESEARAAALAALNAYKAEQAEKRAAKDAADAEVKAQKMAEIEAGLRERMADLYELFGVEGHDEKRAKFTIGSLTFYVTAPEAYTFSDIECRISGEDENRRFRFFSSQREEALRFVGECLEVHEKKVMYWQKKREADEAELLAKQQHGEEQKRLRERVTAELEKAAAAVWQWPDGKELEFYKVSWHRGGRKFGHSYTLYPGTLDGVLHLLEYDGTRELVIDERIHKPIYERVVAVDMDGLPAEWQQQVFGTVAGIGRDANSQYYEEESATVLIAVGTEPINEIKDLIDNEVVEIDVSDAAGESGLAQVIDPMSMARRVTEIDRLTSGPVYTVEYKGQPFEDEINVGSLSPDGYIIEFDMLTNKVTRRIERPGGGE